MGRCNYCGKKVKDVAEHLKREHVGKLSEESLQYLLKQGVPYFRIVEVL